MEDLLQLYNRYADPLVPQTVLESLGRLIEHRTYV